MITAIAPKAYAPVTSATTATSSKTQDAPPANPAPPSDAIDISQIDCPVKAAQLPILEPSFQLGLAAGVAFAIMSGMNGGGGAPLITIDVNNKFGGNDVNANFTFDLKNQNAPLSATGTANSSPIEGSLSAGDQNSVTWNGKIGDNPETLSFGLDQQAQALSIKGKFGNVDANLTMNLLGNPNNMHGPEDFKGYRVSGTLGGQAYSMENNITVNQNAQPGSNGVINLGTMHSTGSLGDAKIDKSYTLTAQQTGGGIEAQCVGSGVNAGVQQNVTTTVTLIP